VSAVNLREARNLKALRKEEAFSNAKYRWDETAVAEVLPAHPAVKGGGRAGSEKG